MTQLERATKQELTEEIASVAASEGQPADLVMKRVALGQIVIPANKNRTGNIVGIGKGLRTKINASIGSSTAIADIAMEVEKAVIAQKYGADTLMDLSVGGDIPGIRLGIAGVVVLVRARRRFLLLLLVIAEVRWRHGHNPILAGKQPGETILAKIVRRLGSGSFPRCLPRNFL